MTRAAYPVDLDAALTALVDAARPFASYWNRGGSGLRLPEPQQWMTLAAAVAAFDTEEPTA